MTATIYMTFISGSCHLKPLSHHFKGLAMQVILIDSRRGVPKSFDISRGMLISVAALAFAVSALIALALYGLTLKYAASIPVPFLREAFMNASIVEQKRQDQFVRENINLMAVQLGEVKAQMLKLEALGERVSGLAGLKKEFNFKESPGRGGLEINAQDISLSQLLTSLENFSKVLSQRSDAFNVLESELLDKTLKMRQIPTAQPVEGVNGSGYGPRIDPFTGRSAFHQGIDFAAPTGTDIQAAAGGVVITSEWHPAYGNMVEIDHGNDLITRYAHSSKVIVKAGDLVKKGQKIAEVGSTGRSTGSHLHFEVLVNGEAQNPMKFLAAGSDAKLGLQK
jgi:murein DD-endopeptidase MepM/ murein hydrolase activator NlpD